MTPSRSKAATQLALPWIVRLRYVMAIWQIARLIAVNRLFHVELPLVWVFIPPGVMILTNLWLSRRLRATDRPIRVGESSLIAGMFFADTLCFTASLMLTGGPDNPYNVLYLVDIALSPTILSRRQTVALGGLACVCYLFAIRFYRRLPALEVAPPGGVDLHLLGTWLAFAVATVLLTVFSSKITELLDDREKSLLHAREEMSKKDRLASLVTLAAGAAHELGTPLATIAVVAKELERYATRTVPNTAIALDSRLIRTEVDRCRDILRRMSLEGAEPAGEALASVAISTVVSTVLDSFSSADRQRIQTSVSQETTLLSVPRHALEQSVISLLRNALDASPAEGVIRLYVQQSIVEGAENLVSFVVEDCGCGMSAETLRHAGEPFYTTKAPGKGTGLGLFLVKTLASRLGGRLVLESSSVGTTATLELPVIGVTEPVII